MKARPLAPEPDAPAAEEEQRPFEAAVDLLLESVAESPPPAGDASASPARAPAAAPAPPAPAGLRTARLVAASRKGIQIAFRGREEVVDAELAAEVDLELVQRALAGGDGVIVEHEPGARPVVVGVLQTRVPTRLELRAETIQIEADREVLLRAGTAAIRIREDGDVEIVGGRILTMSRGLFRLVGRVLRLN